MKNNYNGIYISRLAAITVELSPQFNSNLFISQAEKGLENLEMKARIKQIGEAFFDAFGRDFLKVYDHGSLLFSLPIAKVKSVWQSGIIFDPMAYIIEHYGLQHFNESMFLIGEITKRYTSEFAIRNLMAERASETLSILEQWAGDENEHLRRLASEGSRTRLPWGKKLHNLITEPRQTRKILEILKADPSKYVQTSVANHLNDISKDHTDYFYEIIEEWGKEQHASTRWIIKHALRNEIKKGHPRALQILGFKPSKITLNGFSVTPNVIQLGDEICLSAGLFNEENSPVELVVDFGIHLVKANGGTFFKVFKWKNLSLVAGGSIELKKKYSVKRVTTRVYHPGIHRVELLINGKTMASDSFELKL